MDTMDTMDTMDMNDWTITLHTLRRVLPIGCTMLPYENFAKVVNVVK